MNRILFVCTGNTCRSPMAEVFSNKIFKDENLELLAFSRGIMAMPSKASKNAIEIAKKNGLSLEGHTASPLSKDDLEDAKIIITMTDSHKHHILAYFPEYRHKIKTLAEVAGENADISDPFGGSLAEYESCFLQIKLYLEKIDFGGLL